MITITIMIKSDNMILSIISCTFRLSFDWIEYPPSPLRDVTVCDSNNYL